MRRTLVALVALGGSAGCVYDWSVGGSDASVDGDAAKPDGGSTDAATDTGPAGDAGTESGPTPDATDCAALRAQLVASLAAAKVCDGGVASCQTVVKDECNCDQVLGESATQSDTAYVDAVNAFLDGGCTSVCSPPCKSPVQKGLCVVSSGGKLACNQ